ncbi:MAG TPA: hypothetical protein VK892_06120 [Pyrinomonadaceae bacterium]|nr:hypothetical protein [Pyrinomonadaceae bacterium]
MQDIQNIPPPDDSSRDIEGDFDSHSESENLDIENPNIPVPPDGPTGAPVKDPPSSVERPPIEEEGDARTRLV